MTDAHNILNKIRDDIIRSGFSIVSVFASNNTPSYAYTIGLHETYNHPEIIVLGLPAQPSHGVIANAVESILDGGKKISVGINYKGIANADVVFNVVSDFYKTKYALLAMDYYGSLEGVEFIQMLWPDPEGRFPFDFDFNKDFRFSQPILGPIYPPKA